MSEPEHEELSFEQLMERVGELVDRFEQHDDPEVRDGVFELLDLVEAYHRAGIHALATSIPPEALEAAHQDPLVAHLLESYLGGDETAAPDDLVEDALDEIRPYVHSHGGEMELVGVRDGVVTLRLMGACDGCPASSETLTQGVESILRDTWPGFRRLEVEGDDPPPGGHQHGQQLLQIQSLTRSG